ncbi:hypothetical protein LTR94_030930, partial [Friedmanniomyces endolithicus]
RDARLHAAPRAPDRRTADRADPDRAVRPCAPVRARELFVAQCATLYPARPGLRPGRRPAGARALAPGARLAAGRHARRLRDQEPEPARDGPLPGHHAAHHARHGLRCAGGRRRPGRPGHGRVRGLGRPVGAGAGTARLWRPGRGQCAHRELLRLPHRHLGPRPGQPRLRPGQQVRRRDRHSGAGDAAAVPRTAAARGTGRRRLRAGA